MQAGWKAHTSTRDSVYQRLYEEILQLKLEPGQLISEKEISERMEVSRTPVREAFQQLAREELLEIYPQKGTRVSLIDLSLVEEARFMREHLETAVVKLACKSFPEEKLMELDWNLNMQSLYRQKRDERQIFSLDEQFHQMIFSGCGKSRVWAAIQQMNMDFKRVRVLRLVADYNWDDIVEQHRDLVTCIKKRDAAAAEAKMHEHLTRVVIDKEKLTQQFPSYFKVSKRSPQ